MSNFIINFFNKNFFLSKNRCFQWNPEFSKFNVISNSKVLPSFILKGIDSQKEILQKNTIKFADGYLTNNVLLWGARGNGKSTLIKSVFKELSIKYSNLKLIQLNKNNLDDIHKIYQILRNNESLRFIIFIDDLSFEKIDLDYKLIKSVLDGSIINQPENAVIYVTSNRRHLMPRDMIDNERSSAIHTDESVEEKISLSDRFGIWLGFHNLSQEEYIEIIKGYDKYFNLEITKEELNESLKWSKIRGNRNGRTAWQYILELSSNKKIKINY